MAYIKLFYHVMWHTKYSQSILSETHIKMIVSHIFEYAKQQEYTIIAANGHEDHLHVLLYTHQSMKISKIVNFIKGESSRWINKNQLMPFQFRWQKSYSAFTVSHHQVEVIKNYIKRQKEHHQNLSFKEEIENFNRENNKFK